MIILFDLDGTLIDSTEAILESFDVSFKTFNKKTPDDKDIKRLIGLPLDIMFSKLGIEDEKVWDFVDAYKFHYRKISTKKTKLLPFAKEAILQAHKFARLGIVTTKTAKYSKELMQHFGLMKYFDVLIGREDVNNPKPHPEPIIKAIKKLNTDSKDIFMVGDTCLDILSAKNANIFAIGVKSGYATEKELLECGEIVLNNSFEAVQYIRDYK